MNDSICPSCGKPNPNTVEICQYCGTILKRSATEPLAPLHPGDMPSKIKTSDLESTLPGWLRDVRKASNTESGAPAINQSKASEPRTPTVPSSAKPAPPRQQNSASPLDFLAGLSQANDDEEETPDWLKSLQNSMPAPAAPTPTPKPVEQQPADWLSTLQSEVQKDEPPIIESEQNWGFGNQPATFNFDENSETANLDAGSTPDWLAALKAQDEPAAPPVSREAPPATPIPGEQIPSDDLPDWLSTLSSTGTAPASYESKPAQQPPAASDDTPDWLSALSSTGTAPASYESKPAQQPPAANDDTPDWLSALSGAGTAPASYESQPAQQSPSASDDTPDWLSSLGGGFNVEETPVSQKTTSQFTADAPDWLANLGGDSLTPGKKESAEPAPSESLPAADLPSWMADLSSDSQPAKPQIEKTTFNAVPAHSEPQPADSDVPIWMSGLQGLSVEEPASGETLPSTDIPDWMTGLKEEPTLSTQPEIIESAPPVGSEMPSWLAEAMGEKPADKPAEPVKPRKPFDTGSLGELGPLDISGELPDWITRLGESPENPKPVETPEIASADKTWDAIEAPIQFETTAASEAVGFETSAKAEAETNVVPASQPEPASFETAPAETEAAASLPLFSDEQNLDAILSLDMPDWLSGFTPTEAELKDSEVVEKADDANIRPADLPSWVQAMRPVEDVMAEAIGEDEDQQMERNGPLAGLRSVLPTLPGLPALHKPKSYSIKLHVDETQRAQAALLDNLLNSENTPRTVSRRTETIIIRPLRWTIAGILLVTVLLASLISGPLGIQMFPSPVVSTKKSDFGVGDFKKTIDALPNGAPVLIVVDYQPGFAGEMEPAAGAVIRKLTSLNAPLAFISTSPMGPYLAERLLQKFTDAGQPYLLGTQYVNLGYLPGGAGGIQVFAELPGSTVGQDSVQGILVNLWDQGALKNATKEENGTKLSNFAAVVVLTDNPDTGRLWIEQAEPSLRPQPMLMVVSAQAEPLIRPYVISGQLKGLIAGLEGGARYENALGKPAEAHFYWDAFGVSMIVAELLIIIGGAWSLVTSIRTRRAAKEQDEA